MAENLDYNSLNENQKRAVTYLYHRKPNPNIAKGDYSSAAKDRFSSASAKWLGKRGWVDVRWAFNAEVYKLTDAGRAAYEDYLERQKNYTTYMAGLITTAQPTPPPAPDMSLNGVPVDDSELFPEISDEEYAQWKAAQQPAAPTGDAPQAEGYGDAQFWIAERNRDVYHLEQELERLTAENERLRAQVVAGDEIPVPRAEYERLTMCEADLYTQGDDLTLAAQEIEQLSAQVAGLVSALREIEPISDVGILFDGNDHLNEFTHEANAQHMERALDRIYAIVVAALDAAATEATS